MKVAIVGSREYAHLGKVEKYIRTLPNDTIIVSGGAIGVDKWAEQWARFLGLGTIILKPDWNKYGKAAGMIRNTQIVETCDKLVAFWDGKSKGTKDSIDKATKLGKPVEVIR